MAAQQKATINVSVPAESRASFYDALALLKAYDGGLFTSASALIVKAVLEAADRTRQALISGGTQANTMRTHDE